MWSAVKAVTRSLREPTWLSCLSEGSSTAFASCLLGLLA
jgi:hypothetical protein